MKRIKNQSTFFFLLGTLMMASPCLVSCQKESTEMTLEEKETAKKEIAAVDKELIRSIEKMDVESSLIPYLNSPDFLSIASDGSTMNYDSMKKQTLKDAKRIVGYKSATIKEEYRFLTKNQVLFTWHSKIEATLKTGEKYKTDSFTSTMLFSKINNEWKIVYEHSSMAKPNKV